MVVKVYGPARAACPQRVLACLLEKGVEFEVVHVELDKGEQKEPHFLLLQVQFNLELFLSKNNLELLMRDELILIIIKYIYIGDLILFI